MGHHWTSDLLQAAEAYHVLYHVWPEYLVTDGCLRQVGYEIELTGAHTSNPNHLDPGCLICRGVRSALCELAHNLIHNSAVWGNPAVSCHIQPHEGEIVCSGNRPVVAVSVVLRHTRDFARPADSAELTVLNAIQSELAAIGIGAR